MKLSREVYKELIDKNIKWLEANAPDSLERKHIIQVLRYSVCMHYPDKEGGSDDPENI